MRLDTIEGLPIINAKKGITLHVKPCDIKKARKKSPGHCAVALACMREKRAKEVRVHLSRVYLRMNESNWVRYEVPVSMREEIIAFDRGGEFAPSLFYIKPGKPSAQRPGQQGSDKTGKRLPPKKRRRKPVMVKDVRISAHK